VVRRRRILTGYVIVTVPGVAVGAACDAPQTFEGGIPEFDAVLDLPFDDAGADVFCAVPDAAPDVITWTSLYADLFGPASLGQCGSSMRSDSNGSSSCHHDSSGAGAQASGFICGDTQQSCYMGITSPSAPDSSMLGTEQIVVPDEPCNSYLPFVLRHDGGGSMPYYPESVVFSDQDIARVSAWIGAGAPNN